MSFNNNLLSISEHKNGISNFLNSKNKVLNLTAATWTLDDNLVENSTATFTTIQAAIDAASAGDTILVSPGIYPEQIVIYKSLTLLGAQANVNPVSGGRTGGESIIQGPVLESINVSITTNDVVFNGFELTNFYYGIIIPESSFVLPDFLIENITLEYNYMHSDVAFVGFTAQPGVLRNLKINNNMITVKGLAPDVALTAVSLSKGVSTNAIYEQIELTSNELTNLDDEYCLFAGANPDSYIINDMVIGCNHFICTELGSPFNLGNISNGLFINNVVETGDGLIGIQTGAIYGNSFVNGGHLTLWGDQYGFTRPSKNVFVAYNDFKDEVNGLGIRMLTGVLSDTIRVSYNAFRDTGIPPTTPPDYTQGYLIRNFGIGTLDATNNWWGSAIGPTGNTGGLAGPTVTTPFLSSYTLTPSKQEPPLCWPLSTFMLTQPGFWIYPSVNQLLYSITTNGAIATVGNSLGLWGQFDPANPAGGVLADGIGAFISTSIGLVYDGYPLGTTALWQENSSANNLVLPANSSILKAYLFYSATQTNSDQDVSTFIDNPVSFTPPSGSPVFISPDSVTSMVAPTTGSTVYHAIKDVTSLMEGSGSYTLGSVPGVLGISDYSGLENNYIGWTIVVAYYNQTLPIRNLSIWDEAEMVFIGGNLDLPIQGFKTPIAGTPNGKLFISVGNGDNYVAGDQTLFGTDANNLTVLFGSNNGAGNFYQSQINDDNGSLLTTGTFGSRNQPFGGSSVAPTSSAARQGWDKTAVDISSSLQLNQTQGILRFIDPELYFPQYVATQIDITAAPVINPTKSVIPTIAQVGDTLTYTISFTNTGNVSADNIEITDSLPLATSYKPGTISSNVSITGDPTSIIQLSDPLLPLETANISFDVIINTLPSPNPMPNTATIYYDYVPAIGVTPITVTEDTNTAYTQVFALSRGVEFI